MRRVLAIVLPELCRQALPHEAANVEAHGRQGVADEGIAALYVEEAGEVQGDGLVSAVDEAARARGVRVGMRVSEAMARSAHVVYRTVPPSRIVSALADVAEVASSVGSPVEVLFDDTVLVDCTGAAHLFGGEAELVRALMARLEELLQPHAGPVAVALADGPFHARLVASALAARGGVRSVIVSPGGSRAAIADVPLGLLTKLLQQPVVTSHAWLSELGGLSKEVWPPCARHPLVETMERLGVRTFGALAALRRDQLLARVEALTAKLPLLSASNSPYALGRAPSLAEQLLRWLEGEDPRPLVPMVRAVVLTDRALFEDGVEDAAQLLFALRALMSRLSARLRGRRQATNRVDLALHYDRSFVRVREGEGASTEDALFVDLPAALSHTEDLFRAIKAKLEAFELRAPCVAVEVTLSRIMAAEGVQLDLSRDARVHPEALPALLSELSAEIGAARVGVLTVVDDHRPEARSRLAWPQQGGVLGEARSARKRGKKKHQLAFGEGVSTFGPAEPTRLLGRPVPLHKDVRELVRGATLRIGQDDYVVVSVTFERRVDAVAWWTAESPRRDYLRIELRASPARRPGVRGAALHEDGALGVGVNGDEGLVLAWAFVDKRTSETFLHGFWE